MKKRAEWIWKDKWKIFSTDILALRYNEYLNKYRISVAEKHIDI